MKTLRGNLREFSPASSVVARLAAPIGARTVSHLLAGSAQAFPGGSSRFPAARKARGGRHQNRRTVQQEGDSVEFPDAAAELQDTFLIANGRSPSWIGLKAVRREFAREGQIGALRRTQTVACRRHTATLPGAGRGATRLERERSEGRRASLAQTLSETPFARRSPKRLARARMLTPSCDTWLKCFPGRRGVG